MIVPPPLVSIGTPVYNGSRYISETIDSILSQTFRNFELVISDNGSTDDTEELCRRYAALDRRIRYLRQDRNRGAAWNYNEVFRLSVGRYFKWAAADDLLRPEMIERCVAVLEREEDVAVCFPRTLIIDEHGQPQGEIEDLLELLSARPEERFRQSFRRIRECNAVFGVIRADMLRRTSLIGSFISADMHLLSELSLYGRFRRLPELLFLRRDHPRASSRQRSSAGQMEFYKPELRHKRTLPTWRALGEDVKAVWRSPVGSRSKLGLTGFLLRSAVTARHEFLQELIDAVKGS